MHVRGSTLAAHLSLPPLSTTTWIGCNSSCARVPIRLAPMLSWSRRYFSAARFHKQAVSCEISIVPFLVKSFHSIVFFFSFVCVACVSRRPLGLNALFCANANHSEDGKRGSGSFRVLQFVPRETVPVLVIWFLRYFSAARFHKQVVSFVWR